MEKRVKQNGGEETESSFKKRKIDNQNSETRKIYYLLGDRYYGDLNLRGKRQGVGVIYYAKGHLLKCEGEWKDNNLNGKGKLTFEDGGLYLGELCNGRANGRGVFFWPNGDRWQGQWKNNLQNGEGVFYCESGIRKKKIYQNGVEISSKDFDV